VKESMSGPATSAAERLRQHTFEVRDRNRKRPKVEPGVLIKVGVRGERFWCKVQRVRKDGALVAIVDNELLKSPWKVGHELVVLPEHVLETSDPNDMTFASLLSVLGSSEAAMLWREMRLMDGSGATAKPKTFFVLPDIN
jgi:mitochondrial fission protein ELM1